LALLKRIPTDYGTISITRSAHDGSMAYYQNGCFHSQATRQGISICAYVHVIHELIRQARARRILIIGCAGGTLATMLRRLHCHVTVVDINPMAFVIARRYFRLPEAVRCVRRDGIGYLRLTRKTYDAVVIDVFGSDNTVPRPFTTDAFFRRVGAVLSSSGLIIMNVITADDTDKRADTIARQAESTGMPITLFDWPRHKDRNTVIVGGDIRRAAIPSGHEPAWMRADFKGLVRRKPRRLGGA